jgi:hypothetical protein
MTQQPNTPATVSLNLLQELARCLSECVEDTEEAIARHVASPGENYKPNRLAALRSLAANARRLIAAAAQQAAPAPVEKAAPAPMTAHRAAWFLERFKREEKLLGPNEQKALLFAIEALEGMAAQQAAQPVAPAKLSATERLDRLLWEAIDFAAMNPRESKNVDPRTWDHLIVYATNKAAQPVAGEPVWYAVTSKQAPIIDKAIRRLDVAQEYADKCSETYQGVEVIPLYTAAPAPVGLVPLTAAQVSAIVVDSGYDMVTAKERADFINGIRHGEHAHGIKAGKDVAK